MTTHAAAVPYTSTTDAVVGLGQLALAFGRVDRITYHEDGRTPESDTDHTVMLGLVACAFAAAKLPQLDLGVIAQLALVHDLVEVYAGDTPTLRITDEQKADKTAREHAAQDRIEIEFMGHLPWVPELIDDYEFRWSPEARYVKAMDKMLPKITHILNNLRAVREQEMGLHELSKRYNDQLVELREYAADFPPLFELRDDLLSILFSLLGAAQDIPIVGETGPEPWIVGAPLNQQPHLRASPDTAAVIEAGDYNLLCHSRPWAWTGRIKVDPLVGERAEEEWHAIGCGCGFNLGDHDETYPTRHEAIEQLVDWQEHSDVSPIELIGPDGKREKYQNAWSKS